MADINRIMNAYEDAQEATAYARALVLNEELISEDDYKLIISNTYSGDFPPVNATREG